MPGRCPVCSGSQTKYVFATRDARIFRCADCGLVGTGSATGELALDYYSDWSGRQTEQDAGQRYAALITQLIPERESVLIVSDTAHPVDEALEQAGFTVAHSPIHSITSQAPNTASAKAQFGAVVLLNGLSKLDDPAAALAQCHSLLKDSGLLFLSTPDLGAPIARLFGQSWVHWSTRNRWYFTRSTLQLILEKHGFANIWFQNDTRIFSLHNVADRLTYTRLRHIGEALTSLQKIVPSTFQQRLLRTPTSGMLVTALKRERRDTPKLSIVMPVFNERNTVAATLSAVLAKSIEGVSQREVIVVESNSTDGTRDIVRAFENTPGVRVVFEETPRGKGHAVRAGLAEAKGDIILIQDADTEYDINDYDELLSPLLQWRELFVLGSRHQGNWKMRTFTDNPLLAVVFNGGQVFFTWLMNSLYGQNMTDPFTMYKVFRRECLFGLKLECNRFDFDHELVIKLIRKGYKPQEIPVNYWSRSYSEGKKVTMVRDPLLWIKADFKYRFISPLKQLSHAYREAKQRASQPVAGGPPKLAVLQSFSGSHSELPGSGAMPTNSRSPDNNRRTTESSKAALTGDGMSVPPQGGTRLG